MTTTLGVDISIWQDNNSTPQMMDFNKSRAAGAHFAFIKASQATWLDQDFTLNWQHAKASGILRGAYHYMDWTRPAIDQARFFAGVLRADPGELSPVLDYECRTGAPSAGTARQAAHDFLVELAAQLGITPMLYTSPGYWAEFGSADSWWRQFNLWIAHYCVTAPTVPAPWASWRFWQYTPKGDGILFGAESLQIDLDWFNGSPDDLKAFAADETAPPPPTAYPTYARTTTACNIRNAANLDASSDVGDLVANALLEVTGESGEFYRTTGYVHKTVMRLV